MFYYKIFVWSVIWEVVLNRKGNMITIDGIVVPFLVSSLAYYLVTKFIQT